MQDSWLLIYIYTFYKKINVLRLQDLRFSLRLWRWRRHVPPKYPLIYNIGFILSYQRRAIAQAVSRWLPSRRLVRVQVRSCGICGGQSGIGARFLRILRFLLPILIPPTLHIHHHLSSGAGTIGQLLADVPSGLSLTPPQETKKTNNIILPPTIRFPLCGFFPSGLSGIPNYQRVNAPKQL
jgi:hypothetical protein